MNTCIANDIFEAISDILSRPDTQVLSKNSTVYLKISSHDALLGKEISVKQLFESVSSSFA